MLHVPDADATYAKAVERGATPLRPIAENYGARQGTVRDPFGHRWFVSTALEADDVPVEDAPGRRFGDVGYLVFRVPDGERAARFYGELFGWELHAGYQPGAYHVASITPPSGIDTGYDTAEARVYFRVDDIEATAARVRELGGEVLSTAEHDSGGNAECARRPRHALRPLPPPPRLLIRRRRPSTASLFQAGRSRWSILIALSRQILSTCSCVRSFMISSATFFVCGHVESVCG